MEQHHYFFAAKLPDTAKEFLDKWVENNRNTYPFQRWVHPSDYHITLAFLGFARDDLLQKAIEGVKNIATEESSFFLEFNKIGTFGAKDSPRIFWADVIHSERLFQMQKKVYNLCIDTGFSLDKKPFRPHITLARKWMGNEVFDANSLKKLSSTDAILFRFPIKEIVLYETHINEIPKYKEFAIFPLKS
ncbi:RNA 2',3'-cyclic phosphodiesterase [Caldibacillus lycopersici]|uniref:RNA 2',3'-cyclic phosphodiesterase n=1 Tax=Perspicuibacillus lycopersici TaxID=1325689 RepID=A0AAE3ITD5_9BACI|nr:RNA 2',3'-cyclic phosphodiesterase [Perspicuibacillus lycopersici]MCU9614255.1 RNA 2',3'-cyclic phosphodiesterase [Perspicuibacillus lycopersici]